MKYSPKEASIIFYDGECIFCSRCVHFVLARDHKHIFRFTALQGKTAHSLLPRELISQPDSIVLYENTRVFLRSKAVLHILHRLGGGWKVASLIGKMIPSPILEFFYRWIANHRLNKKFQKNVQGSCQILSSEEKRWFWD